MWKQELEKTSGQFKILGLFQQSFVLRIFKYLPFGTFGKEFLPQFLDLRLKSMKFLDNRAMDVRNE